MVKIAVWSDLHLEVWNSMPDFGNPGADLLILSGDICSADHLRTNPTAGLDNRLQNGFYAKEAIRVRQFFKRASEQFDTVLYVMGNHEHYRGRWDRTETILREETARYSNIHLLERNSFEVDNTVFYGATLWSDLGRGDPLTVLQVKDAMNDYKKITEHTNGHYHKLRPITTMWTHSETVHWLKQQLASDNRQSVVITHHAPSTQSIHKSFVDQPTINRAYASNLEDLILDNPQIKLWVHGHVHNCFDYQLSNTRVVCNPRGYPNENPNFDPNLVIDLNSKSEESTA